MPCSEKSTALSPAIMIHTLGPQYGPKYLKKKKKSFEVFSFNECASCCLLLECFIEVRDMVNFWLLKTIFK